MAKGLGAREYDYSKFDVQLRSGGLVVAGTLEQMDGVLGYAVLQSVLFLLDDSREMKSCVRFWTTQVLSNSCGTASCAVAILKR